MAHELGRVLAVLLLAAAALGGCDSSPGAGGEGTAALCRDGRDNDGDGHVDCADQDCGLFVFCMAPDAAGGADGGADARGGGGEPVIAFLPESAGDLYPIALASVPLGGEFVLALSAINTGDADLEIRGLEWRYSAAEPAREGDVPAFRCAYGADLIPCDDGAALPIVLAPGQSDPALPRTLPLWIGFYRHGGDTFRHAELVIRSNDRRGDVTLRFTAGERKPLIQVEPATVTFTELRTGEEQTRALTVRNAGPGPLLVDRFALGGAEGFGVTFGETDYAADETTRAGVELDPPLWVDPGGSAPVAVRYRPADTSAREGELQLHSNDPSRPWTVVRLEALPTGPVLGVDPAHLAFGPRLVGRPSSLPLQLLSRGTEPLEITSVAFAAGSSPDFAVDPTTATANGEPIAAENPLVIPPNELRTIDVTFTPATVNEVDEATGAPLEDTGTLVIRNSSAEDRVELPVDGYGVLQECPVAAVAVDEGEEVIPQTNLHLHGDRSYAMTGEIRRWEWRVEQPAGSRSVFVPSPTFPEPTFEANVAGRYTFSLDVWDEDDTRSCAPATYEVVVIPEEAIHIELLWSTTGDPDETDIGPFAGADVDLHFLHPDAPSDPDAPDLDGDGAADPWFDQQFDTYWFNPHPDWGAFGAEFDDDPGLDRDDTDGAGPENVNLNVPENGRTYQVAVHYWNDHAYGPSLVTVRVYVYQVLVFELRDVRLINYDLWCAAFIDWPSGLVSLCEAPGGGYRITPNYRHPMFF